MLKPVPEEILIRSINGDQQAFRHLVETCQDQVYALAMRFLRNTDEARDVVQESFIRVWKHLGTFDTKRNFSTWLYRIATNCCLDRLKALRRWRRLFSSFETREEDTDHLPDSHNLTHAAHHEDLLRRVQQLVHTLPRKQATVFTLRDLQNLSVQEVAGVTGLSQGSVKSNLYYARRTIRNKLLKIYPLEEIRT